MSILISLCDTTRGLMLSEGRAVERVNGQLIPAAEDCIKHLRLSDTVVIGACGRDRLCELAKAWALANAGPFASLVSALPLYLRGLDRSPDESLSVQLLGFDEAARRVRLAVYDSQENFQCKEAVLSEDALYISGSGVTRLVRAVCDSFVDDAPPALSLPQCEAWLRGHITQLAQDNVEINALVSCAYVSAPVFHLTDGTNYARVKGTALTGGAVDPSKAGVLAKGGTPPSTTTGFTYTSTTTNITWAWSGLTIYRADGTTTSISNSTLSESSLTASTTYYAYPYYDDGSAVLAWVTGSGHGTHGDSFLNAQRSATLTQSQNLQARIPLSNGPMSAATTASGSGGGSGGGGGSCVRHTMLVEERARGVVPAWMIEAGDYLRNADGWVKVLFAQVRDQDTFVRVTVNGHTVDVTPTHPFIAMDENCNPIPVLYAAKLSCMNQLYTVDGADFVTRLELVRDPSGKKMALCCDGDHTFFSGEDKPYILTHNYLQGT